MEFKILKPIKQPVKKNVFELKIKVMHGDGNHYSSFVLSFEENQKEKLENTINALIELRTVPSGYEGRYYKMASFNENLDDNWPDDITVDDYHPATLEDYELFYYNSEGVKCGVNIIM